MKKYILTALLVVFTILSSLCPYPKRVLADGNDYACILSSDAYFYTAPDNPLFLLPKTYYVKVLSYGTEYTKVEYLYDSDKVKKLVGYAKTSTLTFVDYTPNEPYLYKLFDLRYTMGGSPDGSLGEIVITCAYYGDYIIGGKTYCYVLRRDDFGYVEKPVGFDYPENTEYASRHPQEKSDTATPSDSSTSPTQIAILICLCLLVPVLAGLILRPPRRPPYEEE